MKKFHVKIKGIAPLLQARHLSPDEEQTMLSRESSRKAKVKDLTDKEQFEMHAYKNKTGKFIQPSEMIEAAMTKSGTNFKLEGKKTYKDLMKTGILVEETEIVHKNQKFVLDARWGRNKNTGGAVWVVRPRVDDWELEFTLDLLQDERCEGDMLKEILNYAGLYVGIGAWRPKFGRFEIVEWKELT